METYWKKVSVGVLLVVQFENAIRFSMRPTSEGLFDSVKEIEEGIDRVFWVISKIQSDFSSDSDMGPKFHVEPLTLQNEQNYTT